MQKSGLIAFVFLTLTLQGWAQNGVADPTVMTVDGKAVPRSEFEAIYKKNNKDAPVTKEALDEYLDLFVNYKLKVREAEVLGMDTITKFRNELDGYRKQLARPYLIDRELNDALIREAYDRSQEEVRASHILLTVPADAAPEDTLAAWKRITTLRDRILKGEDFATLAKGTGGSDDPSAQKNGGDLGWFSALQMVYPFESAAYNTKVGEVSMPVRTRFGYHIIKVVDRRAARGQVKVAHIMMRSTDQDPPEKRTAVEERIKEVAEQLSTGKITFSDAAFALSRPEEISAPIKSRYGWHIIRLLEKQPPQSFESAKSELKNKISRDSRAEITQKVFMERLRKEYAYTAYPKNNTALIALLDSNVFKKGTSESDTLLRKDVSEGPFEMKGARYKRELLGAISGGKLLNVKSRQYDEMTQTLDDTVVVRTIMEGWSYDRKKAAKLTKPVFSFTGGTFTQKDLLDYIESKQRRERNIPMKELVDQRFNEMVDEKIMAYEDANLEQKYPDFRMLMKEYRDGILLFELTDQKVWGKAVRDTAGLEAFHAEHRNDFMWDTRYEGDLYTCADAAVAKQVRGLLARGKRGDELTKVVNKNNPLALSIESGLFTADQKPFLKGITKPGIGPDIRLDDRVVIADLKGVRQPEPKTMDEARGLITAAYQDHLEKTWIAELRAKYTVSVDQDVLYSIK